MNRQRRLTHTAPEVGPRPFPIAVALRRALSQGYGFEKLRSDLMAGLVVGVVALPLSMALSIGVGAPPQHGLYTAIVAGFVVAATGGSKHQVTGPTAAFIVILAPIMTKHGLGGLLTAGLLAGLILIAMGIGRLGKLIEFIPHPVTTGFTAGIAVVIATLQIKDVFGLPVASMPESYTEKIEALWGARSGASLIELMIAMTTLALLIGLPKLLPQLVKYVPAPLIAIVTVSIGVTVLRSVEPSLVIATIGSRFQMEIGGEIILGIPQIPPMPMLPWGDEGFSLGRIRELMPSAIAIAMLGAIESLLSAVIADGMTGKKHDPDAELVGLGIGNVLAPFFGGIAATGALARTATNVRSGAQSPIAAITHAMVVLLAVLLLAPLVSYIPMASLAGLLLLVAWNMSEVRHFANIVRVAPKSDVFVLVSCFLLTVIFDMVVAVTAGVVLASLLFMRRMADLTSARVLGANAGESNFDMPAGVSLYEIAGPLFFGAAEKAMGAIQEVGGSERVIVLNLEHVPALDVTGLVAFESVLKKLKAGKKRVILAGVQPQPMSVLERAELTKHFDHLSITENLDEAIELGRSLVASRRPSMPEMAPDGTPATRTGH
jgi:sulfate permease, SulP family